MPNYDDTQDTFEERDAVYFYSVANEYGEFSNFAAYPIKVDGKRWPTSEHYFQAQKFAGTRHEERIRKADTPMKAATMGRDRKQRLRKNWDSMRINVMRKAVRAKFTQHEELRELLISTGDAALIEHTDNDAFWGDDGNGSGKNWLGRILMELRRELAQEDEEKAL